MRRDELKQPLQRRGLMERLWRQRPSALVTGFAALFVVYAAGGFWLTRQKLPYAGEPVVTVAIPPVQTIHMAPVPEAKTAEIEVTPPKETGDPLPTSSTSEAPPPEPPHQKIIKLDSHVTIISNSRPSLTRAPVAAVTEDTPQGPLPKIAANGRKPSEVYAKQAAIADMHGDGPKIALVLGGMGLNEKLTRKAVADLPSNVTFAFAPYGNNLQAQVDRARDEGHEVFLQLPMEPVGFPANNPGPKTLLADADPASNHDALLWHLSRFAGYAGVINYMGGRFLTAAPAVKQLFTEVKQRGLTFIEGDVAGNSVADQVAGPLNLPVRHGTVVIDQQMDAAAISAALDSLEQQAQNGEVAIGVGTGLDITIDAVRDWLREAQSRGVILVPASAAFNGKFG